LPHDRAADAVHSAIERVGERHDPCCELSRFRQTLPC
jgi:hypothetical protein